MGFLDIWTIVTGAASVISLLIAMSDKFPAWHKYIVPSGFFLGGLTTGRLSAGAIPAASESMQDPRLVGFLMILIIIFIMLFLFLREMVKKNQDFYAYFVVFMVLVTGVPQLMDKYFDAFPMIPKEDYLLLADSKEKNKDNPGAIRYLEKYKTTLKNQESKAQIDEKIGKLQKAQLGMAGNN
jgi:hypothetical protein